MLILFQKHNTIKNLKIFWSLKDLPFPCLPFSAFAHSLACSLARALVRLLFRSFVRSFVRRIVRSVRRLVGRSVVVSLFILSCSFSLAFFRLRFHFFSCLPSRNDLLVDPFVCLSSRLHVCPSNHPFVEKRKRKRRKKRKRKRKKRAERRGEERGGEGRREKTRKSNLLLQLNFIFEVIVSFDCLCGSFRFKKLNSTGCLKYEL